jgi:hypothetical protein
MRLDQLKRKRVRKTMNWQQEVLDHINRHLKSRNLQFDSLDSFVAFAERKLGSRDQDVLNLKTMLKDVAKLPPGSH